MLTDVSSFFYILLHYLLALPIGYLLISTSRRRKVPNIPFTVEIPVYLALGLVAYSFFLTVFGVFVISSYSLVILAFLALIFNLVYKLLKWKKNKNMRTCRKIFFLRFFDYKNIVPVALFLIGLLYFSIVVGYYGWPPIGDAMNHGLIASLLVQNGKIQLNYLPLSSTPLDNPIGFHVLAASFSLLTGLLPGESVFLLAAAVIILIPLLLYSLCYVVTRSILPSILAFFSALITIPFGLTYYLIGYLFNGPYPNLFGFLGIILFCFLLAIDSHVSAERPTIRSKLSGFITSLHLLVTYPPFVLFPLIYALLRFRNSWSVFQRFLRRWWISITMTFLVSLMIAFMNRIYLFEVLRLVSLKLGGVLVVSYEIQPAFFYTLSGIAVVVATFIAIFFLLKHIHTNIALFYVLVAILCFASLPDFMRPYLSLFLPSRSIVIVTLLSWVLILTFLLHLLTVTPVHYARDDFASVRLKGFSCKLDLHSARVAVIFLLSFSIVFPPYLVPTFTFRQSRLGWFQLSKYSDDYKVLLWVHENIAPNDLILNDYSYSSTYLLSFSVKNVTSYYYLDTKESIQRAEDSHNFWKKPNDYVLFSELVDKYSIEYVLVTSETGYRDWVGVGGDDKYKPKPFRNMTKTIFDNNPYVELVFEAGSAGVYRVVSHGLGGYISTMIIDDEQSNFWKTETTGSGNIGAPVLSDDSVEKKSGVDSLKIAVGTGEYAHIALRHGFDESQDWDGEDFVAFYWFGNDTGIRIQFFVRGPSINDYKRYDFVENWMGWRLVILPLKAPTGTYGAPSLSEVVQIQFTLLNGTQGTWHLDRLLLFSRQ